MAASIALTPVRLLLARTVTARIIGVVKVDDLTIAFPALCTPAGETIPTAKEAVDVIAAILRILSQK